MIIVEEDTLVHYGTPRHSGRYPWGSGGNVPQDNMTFFSTYNDLKSKGLSEKEIAVGMGFGSTTELRAHKSVAGNERKAAQIHQAQKLSETGMSTSAIGREMGLNESSVRSLLKPGQTEKVDRLTGTSNHLREQVDKKKYIDVGAGVEHHMGVSRSMLNTSIKVLEKDGYKIHYVKMPQLGTAHETVMKVLAAPGVLYKEVFGNRDKIEQPFTWSEDGGKTFESTHYPASISSKRVAVKWAEDGGTDADGVIYVRPGVKDTSLGGASYAQVRILVDGTHYLKGMAVYKDNLPKGVDLEFHTNKSKAENGGDPIKAMKEISSDPERPFSASIRKQNGVMNILNEEGHWDAQRHDFSSQFLSKQNPKLAKDQLDMTYESKKNQLDEIMSLTNPTVRKKMLEDFAEDVDASAVHLRAASLPRTASRVILPIHSMKETEIYAPTLNNGDRVALVRHPHGGTFEIPELTVNNRNREARATIGNSIKGDAVGIHPKVAEKLSGADFDGDSVLLIRNNQGLVKGSPSLAGLAGFNPKVEYKGYEGMHRMTPYETQQEMGNISNLITDMTIRGAHHDEIVRAVRHSMVVIDAEKHELNYKQSEIDNGIKALKQKWQKAPKYGASTLISRAKSDKTVPERKQWSSRHIDPKTGVKIYTPTGNQYVDKKTGKVVTKTTHTTKLADEKDAHKLSSGTPIEAIYADHSNKLKAMANAARKEAYHTTGLKYSPSAKKAYATEVASLKNKLLDAEKNAPLERQAQILGNAQVRLRMQHNPTMPKEDVRKIKNDELRTARERTGAHKHLVDITPHEWEAIQAGAISPSMLTNILRNTDADHVKHLATPRTKLLMTSAKTTRAKQMLASGYTQAEVAAALGVSLTTLKTGIK